MVSSGSVNAVYDAEKEKLLEELWQVEYMASTGDFWTSVATELYLSLIAHFILSDWQLMSWVLQTRELTEHHTDINWMNVCLYVRMCAGMFETQIMLV